MSHLSDTALLAAEEAYDEVIRAENSRSPYMNTRAFRAAFSAAIAAAARQGGDVKQAPAESPQSGVSGSERIAKNQPGQSHD
jgi:hypothetical protein